MKRILNFFILLHVFWTSASYGQSSEDDNDQYVVRNASPIVPASPNASSLGIYGNIPVGHYTGIPEIKIPLYEIETRDFTLPITLSYHASGIKVAQEASTAGLGWALIAGGCIAREIRHMDDFGSGGYYSGPSLPECTESNDASNPEDIRYPNYLNKTFDSEPDIFTYNFNNMSGRFFFEQNKDRETGPEYRAEAIIANKSTWLKIVCHRYYEGGYFIRFEVFDAYGNTYLFKSREHTRPYIRNLTEFPGEEHMNRYDQQDFDPVEGNDGNTTTAWYLDEIITTKKDTIRFEYETEKLFSSVGVNETVGQIMAVHSGPRPFFSTPPPSFKHYNLTYLKHDQLLLKKITFNRGEIDISYTDRVDIAAADWEPKAKKIDRLTVKNISGDRVLDVRFGHSYLGTVVGNPEHADHREREQTALNCRLLLDKISIFRNNGELNRNYVFSYNRNPLPPKNSSSTDHWGYYNVNSKSTSDQTFHYAPSYYRTYRNSEGQIQTGIWKGINKNSCSDRSQYGVLTSIKFPTGAETHFEYELNDFSNGFKDSADSLIRSGGGLRIKTICDLSDKGDTISVRTFAYTDEIGKSSGTLMSVPEYHYKVTAGDASDVSAVWGSYIYGTSHSYRPITGSAAGMHVGYSVVTERNITNGVDNGYVTYRFENHADGNNGLEDLIIPDFPTIPALDNGLPKEIKYYDNQNNLVKAIVFSHHQVEQTSIKGVMCHSLCRSNSPLNIKFYDLYSERWEMYEKTEYQYFPDKVAIKTEYDYNDGNWLPKEVSRSVISGNSEGHYLTRFTYPTDLGGQLKYLVDANMIGVPVEVTEYKNGNIVSGSKTEFTQVNYSYQPRVYYKLNTSSGDYYTQITMNYNHPYGNVYQLMRSDGVQTTYLWSYNRQYPVLEIKNASYQQVYDALGRSAVNAIENYDGKSSDVPDFQAYGALLRSRLPNSRVSVYTYKPLVGCTSITDPSGRTTYYKYDSANRLSEIRDDQDTGNLLQKFEYHLKNN